MSLAHKCPICFSSSSGLGTLNVRRHKQYHCLSVVNLTDKLKHIGHLWAAARDRMISVMTLVLIISICFLAPKAAAQVDKYSTMAPVDQYLMERNAEILLARSAAPDSISHPSGSRMVGVSQLAKLFPAILPEGKVQARFAAALVSK